MRRRKRKGLTDPEEYSSRVEKTLSKLIDDARRRILGTAKPRGSIRVSLDLTVDEGGEWKVGEGGLLAVVEQALQEAEVKTGSVQPGRLYCYRCDSPSCPHSLPSRPTEVFRGYSSTGQPKWADLGQVLLEVGHPEVDRLYGPAPMILAWFQNGRELKDRQLHVFGKASKSYDILCQIVTGYYRYGMEFGGEVKEQVFALTLQAVESRKVPGRVKLDLNVIGLLPGPGEVHEFLSEGVDRSIGGAIRNGRGKLQEFERLLLEMDKPSEKARRSEILSRVPGVLRELARSIEQVGRRRKRRTQHAEERKRADRPIQTAIKEARGCDVGKILVDEKKETIIILGRKNRIHIFNYNGKHVTSLFLRPDEVDRRIRRKGWRPASEAEHVSFQERLGEG